MATRLQFPFEAGALNAVLALQREFRKSSNNKGKSVVIFDEQKKHDERLLKILEGDLDFTDGYTKHLFSGRGKQPPRLDQILDVPHFSKSHLTVLIQVADIGAFVVNRYIALCSGFSESYLGERKKVEYWYRLMAENMLKHTSIDPPGEDKLCTFYRGIRPSGWSGKEMAATAIAKKKKQPTLCDGI